MPTVDELVAVQRSHHGRLLRIRDVAATLIEGAWNGFAGLSDADADRFLVAAVQISEATKAQTADLAYAYMAASDTILGESADLVPALPQIRGGAPAGEVYRRSIVEARRLVSDGNTLMQALDAGRARAASTARTDVILTNKASISAGADARPWVVGYRRVLTGKSCGLCATASTQRYTIADLQPIHNNCDCDTAEIYGDADPGQVVNRQLLDDLRREGVVDEITKERAAGRAGTTRYVVDEDGTIRRPRDESALEVATHEHGELGPVLTDAAHSFTGPADLT